MTNNEYVRIGRKVEKVSDVILETKKAIKALSKEAVNPTFCILYLTRNLLKGYENKTDNEILKEYEAI